MYRFSWIKDFLYLFYPDICLLCPNHLVVGEKLICTNCKFDLPKTSYTFNSSNPVEQIFRGRVMVEAASANFWFEKGNSIQKLLHQLKYKNQKDVGVLLGHLLGNHISEEKSNSIFEGICPVPIHPKKLKTRGYNQSEYIAKGVSEILDVPLYANALIRTQHSGSQTRKTKIDRWENVKNAFDISDQNQVQNKRILLIDDVITTGATLEACTQILLLNGAASVSIATVAYTL